jgi:hypothetical protein
LFPSHVTTKGNQGIVEIFHAIKQIILNLFYIIQGTSNCGSNNAGCEQLCFHKFPTGTSCGCQLGMKLANDQKSCEDAFKDGKGILGIMQGLIGVI